MAHPVEKAFSSHFTKFFVDLGFHSKDPQTFARTVNDVEQSISVFPVKSSGGGWELTAGGVAVRLPEIEALRAREGFEDAPTAGIPIHLLKPDRKYEAWKIVSPQDIYEIAQVIQSRIRSFGLPYLEELCSSREVLKKMKSEDWQSWFVITPDCRDAVLICATWLNDGRPAAQLLCQQIIEGYRSRHPKYYFEVASLMKRLGGAGELA